MNHYDIWEEEARKEKEYWDTKGECMGYDGTECPKCGRLRIEKYSKSERICEKCHWNITTQAYEQGL